MEDLTVRDMDYAVCHCLARKYAYAQSALFEIGKELAAERAKCEFIEKHTPGAERVIKSAKSVVEGLARRWLHANNVSYNWCRVMQYTIETFSIDESMLSKILEQTHAKMESLEPRDVPLRPLYIQAIQRAIVSIFMNQVKAVNTECAEKEQKLVVANNTSAERDGENDDLGMLSFIPDHAAIVNAEHQVVKFRKLRAEWEAILEHVLNTVFPSNGVDFPLTIP